MSEAFCKHQDSSDGVSFFPKQIDLQFARSHHAMNRRKGPAFFTHQISFDWKAKQIYRTVLQENCLRFAVLAQ